MWTVIAVVFAFGMLSSDNCRDRERATVYLSKNTLSLTLPNDSQDAEVRERMRVIRHSVMWMIESERMRVCFEGWFWEYPFEGRSVIPDKQIRKMFCEFDERGIPKTPAKLTSVKRTLATMGLNYPPYCYSWDQNNGDFMYISGSVVSWEELRMRQHFDTINSKGRANRAVIGGLYGLILPNPN